jgi:uncharacterized protein (DUF58 family)
MAWDFLKTVSSRRRHGPLSRIRLPNSESVIIMIPKEIIKKIRKIEIHTNKLVSDVLAGKYHSLFKGRGMEFSEVRHYQIGDDIRDIDWNVTARMNQAYVKQYTEERELTVMLMVDLSGSNVFGSTPQIKGEIAAEIGALLAFSAIRNNDRVGLLIFTDQVELYIPPKKGRKHVLRVIREMLYFQPRHKGTDISSALDYLNRILKRKAVVFLISDFRTSGYKTALGVANKHHDVIAVTITDPRERELPDVGMINLEDAETGRILLVDTSNERVRRDYKRAVFMQKEQREKDLRSMGVDFIDIMTDQPYIKPITTFFRCRAKRIHA